MCAIAGATAPQALAAPGRGYEMVSPADKSSGAVAFPTNVAGYSSGQQVLQAAAPSGDAVTYGSYAAFADPRGGMIASYRSARTDAGWTTRMWSPAPSLPNPSLTDTVMVRDATDDLSVGWMESGQPFNPLDADIGAFSFTNPKDVYALKGDAGPEFQSRGNDETPYTQAVDARTAGHSTDGSVSLFETVEQLVPETAGQSTGVTQLYARSGGTTKLVAYDDARGAPVSTCGSVVATHNWSLTNDSSQPGNAFDATNYALAPVQGSVSEDASRVYFSAPDPFGTQLSGDAACADPVQLYLRDGDEIIHVSASQRTVPDTPQPAIFQGASADGSRVFFISDEALTDDGTPGTLRMLYEYDVASGDLTLLTPTGGVAGVTGLSRDGSHIYWVQDRALVASADGVAHRVTPSDPDVDFRLIGRDPEASITPDGRHLAFRSALDLTGAGTGGSIQAYLYDADSDELTCVSCGGPEGFAPNGIRLRVADNIAGRISRPTIRNVSDDGSYVFFNTDDPLVDSDDNAIADVYQWHDGVISLVSDGRAKRGAYFLDSSASGRDVFFGTGARLVGRDVDNGDSDIYDARLGGGFAEQEPKAPCVVDQCQGSPTPSPVLATDAVATDFDGNEETPDNPPAPRTPPTLRVTPISAKERAAFARTGSLTLTSRVGGKATVSAQAKNGSKVVASAKRSVAKAGTVKLKLTLSKAARRTLARNGRLRLRVTVSVDGKQRSATSISLSKRRAKR